MKVPNTMAKPNPATKSWRITVLVVPVRFAEDSRPQPVAQHHEQEDTQAQPLERAESVRGALAVGAVGLREVLMLRRAAVP